MPSRYFQQKTKTRGYIELTFPTVRLVADAIVRIVCFSDSACCFFAIFLVFFIMDYHSAFSASTYKHHTSSRSKRGNRTASSESSFMILANSCRAFARGSFRRASAAAKPTPYSCSALGLAIQIHGPTAILVCDGIQRAKNWSMSSPSYEGFE